MSAQQQVQACLREADFAAALRYALAWHERVGGHERLGALYYLSWISLELEQSEVSARWLSELLVASVRLEETWYVEPALLMRAYAWLELGLLDRAESDVEEVEPILESSASVFWLCDLPVLTVSMLRQRIAEAR